MKPELARLRAENDQLRKDNALLREQLAYFLSDDTVFPGDAWDDSALEYVPE